MSQLPLDLPHRPALDREAFFVSASNAAALTMVEAWRDWPDGKLALTGAGGSGKTHLAHVWAADAGAVVVDAVDLPQSDLPALAEVGAVAVEDVDHIADLPTPREAEAALFHLHNMLSGAGGKLLVTGKGAPARWRIATADLASRLHAAGLAILTITAWIARLDCRGAGRTGSAGAGGAAAHNRALRPAGSGAVTRPFPA